jgi:Uma2 family endonuclease
MLKIADKILTLEEFRPQPETESAREYIDGQVSQKPMPKEKHSRLPGKLITAIN